MTAELSPGPAEPVADPDLAAVPAVAAAELDGLASETAWQLLVRGSRQASRGAAVRAVTAVGPADQRRLVVVAALAPDLLRELQETRAFAVGEADADTVMELELESLSGAGASTLLVGRPIEIPDPTAGRTAPVSIPTPEGVVRMIALEGEKGEAALLVEVGAPAAAAEPIVYLHRGCLLGDALGSLDCPRRRRLAAAMERMRRRGGVVVYLRDDASLGGCCVSAPTRAVSATLRARIDCALGDLGVPVASSAELS